YIGCLGVNTSMKSLDFDTRSLIAKECINRVCEAAGLKTADKKRRTEKRIARMLADAPNMENAGVDVNLSITSAHLNLIVAESGEHLAKHEMPNISFASGGDTDTLDFAAYVAKDNRFGRACFVLECGGGRAQDVITTIGQAFELRFKEFLKRTPRALTDRLDGTHFNGSGSALAAHSQAPPPRADDREYYNDLPGKIPPDIVPALPASAAPASVPHAAPRKKNGLLDQVNLIDLTDDHQTVAVNGTSGDANTVTASQLKTPLAHDPQYVNCTMAPQEEPKDSFDMQPFTSALADDVNVAATTTTATTTSTSTTSKGRSQPVGAPAGSVSIAEVEYVANCELDKEDWFHGPIPRKQSEELVIRDGDFLVRESKGSSGSGEQYVLTGMQSGTHKHLLLVDPEGVVRTKDKTFESVSHLINYHRNNGLPIISSESALILKNPIVAPKLSTLKTN
ncbi:PREDICTED: SHC-transforming protein 1-like, partial [Rhagoletis zephyria]|uniref:SHC-transforming protein 1-like n=1 Tax=Rhagoletis zephyria TaxID=28612 RepID=UPI0008118935